MSPAEQLELDLQRAVEGRDHVGLVHALGALQGVDPTRCKDLWLSLELGLLYRRAWAPMIQAVGEHLPGDVAADEIDGQLTIDDALEVSP